MKRVAQFFVVIIACFMLSGCVVQVEDGQVGVKNDFGHIRDEVLNAGWHFFVPAITQIELWNVKLQELKETAEVPSSEGLISQLDISIMYQVPADKASFVRKKIGPYYVSVVLEPYVRESIRNVASGYAVKALYSEAGRKEIGKNILSFLQGKLDEKGIMVQDVLLRDVKLPPSFSQSIELKLKAEQEALQKEFELLKAKKDAEIEVAKAEGVAKANQIIGDSLKSNDSYLKYLWIRGLKDTKDQVIYVPTETGLPILEASRNQNKQN
jgi:regulator of protease activity HflC (stomatin/prohibitin superfamily)